MKIVTVRIADMKPYDRNPRKNEQAVKPVAESIRQFGFRVPIVLDKDGVIVCGHTRYLAAKELGMQEVPCVYADDLSPEQVKAFRLADNKTAEIAGWDFRMLEGEIREIKSVDMSDFGFQEESDYEGVAALIDSLGNGGPSEEAQEGEKEVGKKVKCPHCGAMTYVTKVRGK